MFISPLDILGMGLRCLRIQSDGRSRAASEEDFHAHFGSSPLDLADMWYDLTTTTIPESQLTKKEKTERGLRMFLMAHHFLWTYPKNARILASRWGICERLARGAPLWDWIKKIAGLKTKKIVWDNSLDDPDSELFIVSIDGTDCRTWEKKHPLLNLDRKQCSVKFNHGAVKYLLAISVYRPKCVFISGPHRGGMHDLVAFREEMKAKMPRGKLANVDRGFRSSRPDETMLSIPNAMDSVELNNFKSRSRLRHETFNGRIKFFNCLSDTFRHSTDIHKFAFEAVCVTVQYQMDNGSPIYAV
jgi:hypothetical protein